MTTPLNPIDLGALFIGQNPATKPGQQPAAPEPTNKKRGKIQHCTEQIHPRCIKRKDRTIMRRAFSETKLLDILDHDFENDTSYHCITGGDIDSLSFLKTIIRQQPLDYLLFSTWCMADDDVLQFREWLAAGKINRLDCYLGEIFPNQYRGEYSYLKTIINQYQPDGRVCIFKNHSKIYAGTGPKFSFAIESSANINTNPRTENSTINISHDLYLFYKEYFDGIKSFTADHPDWQPWPTKKS